MSTTYSLVKRVLIGRPLASDQLDHQRLSKRVGLAVFSSDAISSSAYASEEILHVLVPVAGAAAVGFLTPISFVVALLLVIVIASYRQTIHAYPDGGGSYVVSRENLGVGPSLVAGASLLVDYVLTVAVSVSAGVAAIASFVPFVRTHRVLVGLLLIALLAVVNLRGVKESGRAFAIPTYAYILVIAGLLAAGAVNWFDGGIDPITLPEAEGGLAAAAGGVTLFLLARAFSSGAVALTGVEAISNGVPAFRRPESRNASTTLIVMGVILGAFFLGISLLAQAVHPVVSFDETVLSQLGRAVFGGGTALYIALQVSTAAILTLAANTAYADFPRLGALIARDGFLPRQLRSRGDRLVFSNGILLLSGAAAVLYAAFGGSTTALIPLYAVGVFLSFTLSQAGMVRHHLKLRERGWQRGTVVNAIGALATAVVLVVVVVSKFTIGAWVPAVVIPLIVLGFKAIRRHYDEVRVQLRVAPGGPARDALVHSHVILVSGVHRGVLLALRYARSLKPKHLVALCVVYDTDERARIEEEWHRHNIPVPLQIVESPERDLTRTVLAHLDHLDDEWDHEFLTVVLPEFVVDGTWEKLLHNQSALVLKLALLTRPGTALVNVPYHLTDPDDHDSTAPEIDARGRVARRRLRRGRLDEGAPQSARSRRPAAVGG